jgi:glycosyltransferase involved in cell wall biosynthesis
MPNKLRLNWPETEPGSELSRYAQALEQRLDELGVSLAPATDADAIDGAARQPPQAFAGESLFRNAGSALDCRPDPSGLTFFAFAAALDADETSCLIALHTHLAALAPYRVQLVVVAPGLAALETCRPVLAEAGIACCSALDTRFARQLLAADAALVSGLWPQQNLLAAVFAGVPALVQLPATCDAPSPDESGAYNAPDTPSPDESGAYNAPDTPSPDESGAGIAPDPASTCRSPIHRAMRTPQDHPIAGQSLGLAAQGASPRQLAGLLLLLATEPGVRRKVLDAQDALRRAHQPAAQRQAIAAWLARLDIEIPAPPAATGNAGPTPERPMLRIEGVFDSSYSLAIVNRQLAMALQDLGENAALYTYEQGDNPQPAWHNVEDPERIKAMWLSGNQPQPPAVSLRNAWPPIVRDMRGRRRVLASYAWEETAYPPAFAADFNHTLDLITVVSQQTADFLRDAGVSTPIAVVGNGIDHLVDLPNEPLPRPLPAARYRFLHISSCFPRKGADVLLKAYGDAFTGRDDVALIIKTFPNPHNDVRAQLERLRQENPGYPRVDIIEEDWTPGQIASLYRQCHALVAPSRGEGFGLPIAEAMIYGLPVIVTGWGGHRDFCHADNCWLIDYTLQPAQTHLGLDDSLWAEPDRQHLAAILQDVHALQGDSRRPASTDKTARARQEVLARYTWRKVAERTRLALHAIDARPGLAPGLRIGWVSTWGSRCGIAAYSQHLVSGFINDDLHIFAPSGEITEADDPPRLTRNWAMHGARLDQLIADAAARKLDALVIQFNWEFFSLDALADLLNAMQAAGTKVYIDFHNTRSAPPGFTAAAAIRTALASAERLLVHTLDDLQRLQRMGYTDNLMRFPLAVYPVQPPTDAMLQGRRQRLGLQGRQVIASYGFLMPHKGLMQLVEAMPALLAARPQLHLLMVNALYSPERSKKEHHSLIQRIKALGIADRVTLQTDFLPEEESLALLKLADLVIFPYQQSEESSSAAVRMALAAGCPVAVTPLPIFHDVAAAVSTLPGIDPASIASGITQLLAGFDQPGNRAAAIARGAKFAASRDAGLLSRRLRGLIAGGRNDLPTDLSA